MVAVPTEQTIKGRVSMKPPVAVTGAEACGPIDAPVNNAGIAVPMSGGR